MERENPLEGFCLGPVGRIASMHGSASTLPTGRSLTSQTQPGHSFRGERYSILRLLSKSWDKTQANTQGTGDELKLYPA